MKLYIVNRGRFGNICFQALASILLKIITGAEIVLDPKLLEEEHKIIDDDLFLSWINSDFEYSVKNLDKNCDYKLYGYFQHDSLYKKYMKEILDYIKNNLEEVIYKSDDTIYYLKDIIHSPKGDYSQYNTVVHLRIADYIDYDLIIDPRSLDNILEKCEKPILFVHEEPKSELEKAYIKYFDKYSGNNYINNMLESYSILRTARNIVGINSTFSFLAILFNSSYDKVYVPINKNKDIHVTLCGPSNCEIYDYNIITKKSLIKLLTDINLYIISKDIMLNSPDILQNSTHVIYPIFKEGKYMEEYFLTYIKKKKLVSNNLKYIDVLWTNVHHKKDFNNNKDSLNIILKQKIDENSSDTKYFTVVQWDDGPLLNIPKDTIIFGACSGTIPLPLIYEDVSNKLLNIGYYFYESRIVYPKNKFTDKNIFCSFVGSKTHNVREKMINILNNNDKYLIFSKGWNPNIKDGEAQVFIHITSQSKFALAPRGYGRSSFRFFEILQLGTIPIYIYDDIEWLPYKEFINYDDICISIHESQIEQLDIILSEITEQRYNSMIENYIRLSHYFTLEGMSNYILSKILV
jgi:hypothetical protein